MYYVYEWYIKETNEVFYVGKGCRNRYRVKKHNKFFDDMTKRFDCDSRIIRTFETEKEAFDYEYLRINELKEIGQCVCNKNDGGKGGSTEWWTDEKRKLYSERNVMKSEKQRERMSKNNPMKNKEISQRVNAMKRRKVIIGDTTYQSVNDASIGENVCFATIKKWCKKGINPKGVSCRYADEKQVEFIGKRYNKGGCKPITYKGNIYESAVDLANELNLHNSTITQWVKKGFDPYGNECRFVGDKRELKFNPNRKREINSKPIIVNGVWYPSKKIAEKSLGLSKGYLAPYIAGTRKNSKYVCEYDNQQPSQGKSDNSTLEGSTTNE